MIVSKVWFVLVCLVGGVALTAAFVAPRSATRQLAVVEAQGLDRAQYAAEQMLKTDAQRWINHVAKLGRDAVITEALDSATKGQGETRVLHDTVQGRLRALVPETAGIGLDGVIALDGHGRVVARLGTHDAESGDSLAGTEAVTDALRGYMTDDVWNNDGKLERVAAAPVLAKSRDHIVGVVMVLAETGKRLVDVWRKNLGVDVTLVVKGQVSASTLAEGSLGTLGDEIARRKDEITAHKRTRAFPVPLGADTLLAVAAPFVGEAGEMGASYVLMSKQAMPSDPASLLLSSTATDLAWNNFPWGRIVVIFVAMLGVGLALQRYYMEAPLGRLRQDVQRLARGETQKLADTRHPGRFGGIARDVNASLERFTHAAPAPASETAGKDLNAILGNDPRAGATPGIRTFDLPSAPVFGSGPSSGGAFGLAPLPSSSPGMQAPGFGPMPTPTGGRMSLGLGFSPAPTPTGPGLHAPSATPGLGALPSARLSSPPMPGAPPPRPAAFQPPSGLPPPARPPAPVTAFPPLNIGGTPTPVVAHNHLASLPGGSPLNAPPSQPMMSPSMAMYPPTPPPPVPIASPVPAAPRTPAPPSREMDDASTESFADDGNKTVTVDGDDRHFREVFDDYVETRKRCGESTSGLTLEKFRAKLEANKQQLIAKYNCRSARFSVYVKDGKAAIKAAPVRD